MNAELPRELVVSCQAESDSPFNAPGFIAAFAKAAELGGASGVRICGVENIRAVRALVRLPIIGLTKGEYPDGSVLVTPTEDEVRAVIEAGADIVATDGTRRERPGGMTGTEFVRRLSGELPVPLMADVSTHEEGLLAARAGAALVATTLAGYTPGTRTGAVDPDLALLASLARELPGIVVAEGRFWTPDQARAALALGARAVVVGTAITRPVDVVRRWVRMVQAPEPPSAE